MPKMTARRLLFSVTAKDFDVETFCTSGNGGQHRNAKRNGVRIRHCASGAVAEHRDGRDQGKNRSAAFAKLVETKEWKAWHRAEVARVLGITAEAEREAERAMSPGNLKVEVKDENGRWVVDDGNGWGVDDGDAYV
jgi:protein subunit release factor A